MRRVRHNFSWQGRHFFHIHILKTWLKFIVYTTYIILFTYVCETEGRGTRSHHRVGYAGHIIHQSTWHTVFGGERWKIWQKWRYSSVLQYKPRFSYARQTLPVWKHNGPALLLLCIRTASAPLTLAVWNRRNPRLLANRSCGSIFW